MMEEEVQGHCDLGAGGLTTSFPSRDTTSNVHLHVLVHKERGAKLI